MSKTCCVYKKEFADSLMRECPCPAVQHKYGTPAWVSVYVCKKCKYAKHYEMHGGISCEYKEEGD